MSDSNIVPAREPESIAPGPYLLDTVFSILRKNGWQIRSLRVTIRSGDQNRFAVEVLDRREFDNPDGVTNLEPVVATMLFEESTLIEQHVTSSPQYPEPW